MRTNIEIDDDLMAKAMKALNVSTKRAAVEEALRQVVKDDECRQALKNLAGMGWEGDLEEMRKDSMRTFEL